mmetsp:Transcript_5879/g.18047  ORF Transcript_5879/g.18047 Transcript_5879/m.18047 type:complete len:643 (+) Transcript_5879:3157-5085(+)
MARDEHVVGVALDHARRNDADAVLRHQLDRDTRTRVGALEVVDELRQVLNGVDVVVRRRRDEADARRGVARLGNVALDLVAGQLAALAWLCALRHLDLQLISVGQVVRAHTKPPARNLLDRRPERVGLAVGRLLQAPRVLAALAAVGLAAHGVHRERERRVRLEADRPVAHRAGDKALDDRRRRLDLFQRDGLRRALELEQAAQVHLLAEPRVERRELAVRFAVVCRRRRLQLGERLGVVHVLFGPGAGAVVVVAWVGQRERVGRAVGRRPAVRRGVQLKRVCAKLRKADAADARRRAAEALVNDLGADTKRLKDLRALVRRERADAHLGHGLEDADPNALCKRLDQVVAAHRRRQAAVLAERKQRLVRQVRARGVGTVRHEQAELLHLAQLAALHHDAHARALLQLDERMVHTAGRQQRADGHPVRPRGLITQHHKAGARVDCRLDLRRDARERKPQPRGALGHREGRVHDRGGPAVEAAQRLDRGDLPVGDDGLREVEPADVPGLCERHVRLRADERAQRRDNGLAERIDCRVGHLRKQLLEVLERLLGALAEHRERGVVAHGAERLGARLGHRRQDVLQGFKRVPKQLQLLNQRVQRRARRRTGLGVKREDVVRGRVGRSSRQRRSRCLRRRRLDNVGH